MWNTWDGRDQAGSGCSACSTIWGRPAGSASHRRLHCNDDRAEVLCVHTHLCIHLQDVILVLMRATPFQDTARRIANTMSFQAMSVRSEEVRSHGWWKNVVQNGAWGNAGVGRVGPPDRESIPGIAKLFGTTEDEVAFMIAADWYGVSDRDTDLSARAQKLGPVLDELTDDDMELVELLVDRLRPRAA